MKRPNIFEVFRKELELIVNDEVFQFTTSTLDRHVPGYFFYIPASVKGHHPPICRVAGGLVHHTKLATAFAKQLAESLGIYTDMIEYSQIIAGALLHDGWKRGHTVDELETWEDHREANKDHGRFAAEQLSMIHGYCVETQDIIEAVKYHMGPWTSNVTDEEKIKMRSNKVIHTVHLADYMASRALHQLLAERAMDKSMEYLYE